MEPCITWNGTEITFEQLEERYNELEWGKNFEWKSIAIVYNIDRGCCPMAGEVLQLYTLVTKQNWKIAI